jgi:TRAP-type mannitol/chloroaromatic compound transport system substrate-binding protein
VDRAHDDTKLSLQNTARYFKTGLKGKVEVLQLPASMVADPKKLAADVVNEESERSSMAKRVRASFVRSRSHLAGWSRISEGAYPQFVAP